VGAELTRLRVAQGWSQQKLADELGYTERYIDELERGTKSPTGRTIADIGEASDGAAAAPRRLQA
jgi:transcriptional regulator with XRE-family HTH domain